jgi:hypothetical protein
MLSTYSVGEVGCRIVSLQKENIWVTEKSLVLTPSLGGKGIHNAFFQDEIGTPCKDFILEAGDMVYLPRGTIHQVS